MLWSVCGPVREAEEERALHEPIAANAGSSPDRLPLSVGLLEVLHEKEHQEQREAQADEECRPGPGADSQELQRRFCPGLLLPRHQAEGHDRLRAVQRHHHHHQGLSRPLQPLQAWRLQDTACRGFRPVPCWPDVCDHGPFWSREDHLPQRALRQAQDAQQLGGLWRGPRQWRVHGHSRPQARHRLCPPGRRRAREHDGAGEHPFLCGAPQRGQDEEEAVEHDHRRRLAGPPVGGAAARPRGQPHPGH
mmetsp:Transcript_82638/g.184530  ORF Transcript_82638/g.184530 Transcript_82638/m.184530 type:complete len:248 (-) Transcript_82638:1854-2597(-)